jgi:hypothetical protein
LPAHEAILFPPFEFRKDRRHTGIAYHSQYGWAHDWIDFWTSEEAFPAWELDLKTEGQYQVSIKYALEEKNLGDELILEVAGNTIVIDSLEAFIHSYKPSHDRIAREQEAPETDWAIAMIGSVKLEKGPATLSLKASRIIGESSIELKEVLLTKKTD